MDVLVETRVPILMKSGDRRDFGRPSAMAVKAARLRESAGPLGAGHDHPDT